ncbi:MAG: DUF1801 domain-containing protein [Gloeobacteraceae cyanobacterium ES-bin-316]|nr:DUF1801 domain-containing protein [Ferruginibacter sp.]
MLRPIDQYFFEQVEPVRSCLLFLRQMLLAHDENITESFKYSMPFYAYNQKRICYLWIHKKYKLPYLGIVDGHKINDPDIIAEKRTRMKILLINPTEDLHVEKLKEILDKIIGLHLKP